MINDPIADMLTRMRNANKVKHENVKIPYSKIKHQILNIFLKQGYINDFKISQEKDSVKKDIVVYLKYNGRNKVRAINGLKRVSKPGLRVYSSCEDIPKVLNGYGVVIISTSKGIITGKEARQQKIGGELVAYVW